METETMTEAQQRTIAGLLERLCADGFGVDAEALAPRPLADEAAEFHNFDGAEVQEAGEGAVVVFRPPGWPAGVECEIPERGLVIAADGRMVC